jgi:hypothetical protein
MLILMIVSVCGCRIPLEKEADAYRAVALFFSSSWSSTSLISDLRRNGLTNAALENLKMDCLNCFAVRPPDHELQVRHRWIVIFSLEPANERRRVELIVDCDGSVRVGNYLLGG